MNWFNQNEIPDSVSSYSGSLTFDSLIRNQMMAQDNTADKSGTSKKSYLNKIYERLIKIRGEPQEIAMGLALGLFIGMMPIVGFQIVIAVFLASIFKINKISAGIGVWISNPITIPFLYGLTYVVGAKIMGIPKGTFLIGSFLTISGALKVISNAPEIFWALVIGGVILGLPLAVIGYYLCYSAVRKYQEDLKQKISEKKAQLALKRKLKKRQKS